MTIVRKFQLPEGAKLPSAPESNARPSADFDIPEINTNFMDNLFHDPAFVDRFDASFQQTAPMGIEAEAPKRSPDPVEDWNMIELEFPTNPKT